MNAVIDIFARVTHNVGWQLWLLGVLAFALHSIVDESGRDRAAGWLLIPVVVGFATYVVFAEGWLGSGLPHQLWSALAFVLLAVVLAVFVALVRDRELAVGALGVAFIAAGYVLFHLGPSPGVGLQVIAGVLVLVGVATLVFS